MAMRNEKEVQFPTKYENCVCQALESCIAGSSENLAFYLRHMLVQRMQYTLPWKWCDFDYSREDCTQPISGYLTVPPIRYDVIISIG
jgi:hypothetical protein